MKCTYSLSVTILTFAASLLLFGPLAADQQVVEGRWDAERSRWNGRARIQIKLRSSIDGERVRSGFSVDVEKIDGDVLAERSADRIPILFELHREAGTFTFEGEQDGREAWGDFTWNGNADFLRQMTRRGYDDITVHEQFSMTMFDVSTTFLDGMERRGYDRLSLQEMLSFRIHGVDSDYVDELAAEGFHDISVDDLLALRIHGVSGEYAREMDELGFDDLDLDDLLRGRIHGVTASYVRSMEELGYSDLSANRLREFRIHGVNADFVRELERHGGRRLSAGGLVRAKVRGDWWRE